MPDFVECPVDDVPLDQLLAFALTYNGYERLGQDPDHLHGIVRPVLNDLESGRRPPSWAGLDLLRGTLFYIQRMTHHWGEVPQEQEGQMRALLPAIRAAAAGRPVSSDDAP